MEKIKKAVGSKDRILYLAEFAQKKPWAMDEWYVYIANILYGNKNF